MSKASIRGLLFGFILAISAAGNARAQIIVSDDFSTDTGRWNYFGTATRDPGGYVVLTRDYRASVGQIWLNSGASRPFQATFKYLSGGAQGSTGDGLVLMFYHASDYSPDLGASLGFTGYPYYGDPPFVPGYGVEVDNCVNAWETAGVHLGLIEGNTQNHLAYALDPRAADGLWHDVEVNVEAANVTVSIDGVVVFTHAGALDRSFAGLGFSAATAMNSANHFIDDVVIREIALPVDFVVANPVSVSDRSVRATLFGSTTVAVREVDLTSLRLQTLARDAARHVRYSDVNGDGIEDLTASFDNQGGTLVVGEYQAQLSGSLTNGSAIFGFGTLIVVEH